MSEEYSFSSNDICQLTNCQISLEEAKRQLNMLLAPPQYADLIRAATLEDGICSIQKNEHQELLALHNQAASQARCMKFVPASGAASRMFKELLSFQEKNLSWDEIKALDTHGDREAHAFIFFMENLTRFPFYESLINCLEKNGIEIEKSNLYEIYPAILENLLTSKGMNYAYLPKALLAFHNYSISSRTAFEEQLVESAQYIKTAGDKCTLHFTVSPEHVSNIQLLFDRVRDQLQRMLSCEFQVSYSVQKKSTDMLALDNQNKPFRNQNGEILLRPGGHGALIENLNDLKGDIVFIKNIDNVQPDRLKATTILYKKLLAGVLIRAQNRAFSYLHSLHSLPDTELDFEELRNFANYKLNIPIPTEVWLKLLSLNEKRALLIQKLNRPIRVCGVVKNTGEPGGGPFWATNSDGIPSLQIIEGAQVDHTSSTQSKIFYASTHFNPVDIVCGLKNFQGNSFDLHKYIDPNAVILTKKSFQGRDLLASERPGLWNGGMADWITIFVEVPEQTFTPVKTVNDLLRASHQ